MFDIKKYQRFAQDVAEEAGNFLSRRLGKIKRVSYKGRMNLITDVDTHCEHLILNRIKKAFPDHRILAEESGDTANSCSQFCWLIDPLDGTTNYAHSFPFFAVSIALLMADRPIVGVVYDPERKELFYAAKGSGAYLNHKRIRVSKVKELKRSLLATGFPYRFGRPMRRNIDNFIRFMMRAQAVRRAGSAALDLCYVAAARFDGFWEIGLHPWDTAAGALIVEEAGGEITRFDGGGFSPFEKEVVASNSKIHKQMLEVLK